MSSISCPFCGEMMDSPLRFCVACGRAITADDLKRAGLKLAGKREGGGRPEVAKRDYTFQRKMRSMMYSTSAVLILLIGYYVMMKYVLHEHMPGNIDTRIEALVGGQSADSAAASGESASPEKAAQESSRP